MATDRMSLRSILNVENVVTRRSPSEDRLPRTHSQDSGYGGSASPSASPSLGSDAGSPRSRREFRASYSLEEEDYIWYQRDDIGLPWNNLKEAYARQFPGRRLQGLQCKYYRCLSKVEGPQIRERDKDLPANAYGLVAWSTRRYSWMRPEHRNLPMGRY